MGASRRLDTVHRVVGGALKASSLRSAANLFEEIDPEWFMDIEHVERLYSLVAFEHVMLRRGALEAVRAGNYVVLKPNMRSTLIRREYDVVESLLVNTLNDIEAIYEEWNIYDEYTPFIYNLSDVALVFRKYYSPAVLARFYTMIRRGTDEWAEEGLVEINSFIAAVIGIDSDTGLLFVDTLPPGTGLAALIVERELKAGNERAVKAIMGYDLEASEWDGGVGSVVRLQGDLYVRVNAYTDKPREVARRIASLWTSAVYSLETLDKLILEYYRAYGEEVASTKTAAGVIPRFRAAARALEKAVLRTYPWVLENGGCNSGNGCDGEDRAAHDFEADSGEDDAGSTYKGIYIDKVVSSRINTKPFYMSARTVPEHASYHLIVSFYRDPRGIPIETTEVFEQALANITNPAWVSKALYIWSSDLGEMLEYDLGGAAIHYLWMYSLRSKFPRLIGASEGLEELPAMITAAAAARALLGMKAPEPVVSAVKAVGEASIVEADVGDHKVTLEGYLLEGPAMDAVITAEVLADTITLRALLSEYMDHVNPLTALKKTRSAKGEELKISVAKLISRIFMAKERLLAAVTAGSGEIVAAHPEHGRASMELPRPALVTVTSNPAVIYTIRVFPRGSVPSYLKDRLREASTGSEDFWVEEVDEEEPL